MRDNEDTAHSNLPESLADSERGEAMQSAIETLDEVIGEIDIVDLQAIREQLADL